MERVMRHSTRNTASAWPKAQVRAWIFTEFCAAHLLCKTSGKFKQASEARQARRPGRK